MTATPALDQQPAAATPSDRRRWFGLAFIAVAQLMIALDATIVSIALPSAQSALGASDADRQWVITAYSLAFGGLLLVGGRIGDFLGHKRAFVVGLAGFALASAIGGAAPSFGVLVAARAMQGAFAALLAPTALSLLAISFREPRERATAFAVYGSIAGSGAAIGMLLGGALTQYLSWRWCLYVNLPIAVAAAVGGWVFLAGSPRGVRAAIDLPGVLLSTGGLVSLVYGSTTSTPGLLAVSAAMFVLFVLRESRAPEPLLPLRILTDRNRAGAYITVALAVGGMFGAYLFLTYYLQVVMGYTPLQAGLAFLPITVASQAGSWLIARRLVPRVAPRLLMVPATLVAAAGIALLSRLQVQGDYLTLVLPAELLIGAGISSAMVPAFSLATSHVDRRDAGVASATVNAAQQIGASLGTAVLNTIAAAGTAAFAGPRAAALVHGFSVATVWAAGALVLAAVAAGLLITAGRPEKRS
jgi:EmrB/QacA subfamily drug resistance transporter